MKYSSILATVLRLFCRVWRHDSSCSVQFLLRLHGPLAAFNTLDPLLLKTFLYLGLQDTVLCWFLSQFSGYSFSISLAGSSSLTWLINSGQPQSSGIVPFFYLHALPSLVVQAFKCGLLVIPKCIDPFWLLFWNVMYRYPLPCLIDTNV